MAPKLEQLLDAERVVDELPAATFAALRQRIDAAIGPGPGDGGPGEGGSGGDSGGDSGGAPTDGGSAPGPGAGASEAAGAVSAGAGLAKLGLVALLSGATGVAIGVQWERSAAPSAPVADVEPADTVNAEPVVEPAEAETPEETEAPEETADSEAAEAEAANTEPARERPTRTRRQGERPASMDTPSEGRDAAREELRAERLLIDRARAALGRSAPRDALRALLRHESSYRDGALSEEREALRIRALVQLGDDARARRALERFRTRFPRSPLTAGLEAMLP
ncbi:MAG: hypothetical protein AAF938_19710 [Myxococcota bacterium]